MHTHPHPHPTQIYFDQSTDMCDSYGTNLLDT